jgi:glycosyltransferase involved in cell wall biosynthesis
MSEPKPRATLSVAIITFNEEDNIGRTLSSVKAIADEIIVVDSGSTDRTVEIAKQFGAKVYVEGWKGFAAQKNSALDKCACDWILSLDADEEVTHQAAECIGRVKEGLKPFTLKNDDYIWYEQQLTDLWPFEEPPVDQLGQIAGIPLARRNLFLGRWIKRGGFYPDDKLRLFCRSLARFENRAVHEDVKVEGPLWPVPIRDLIHHSYPTLTAYIEHMNRYSSLGAEMVLDRRSDKRGRVGFSILNIVIRPIATFTYNYFFRLGFLDGKEGLLLHLYHSVYVSWKYAKAWELSRQRSATSHQ